MSASISTPDALWASPAASILGASAVRCRRLRFSVDGKPILESVDLDVPLGTRLLLTERTGDGTAILLRILAGLARSERGWATVAGLPVGGTSDWRRHVGYVASEFALYRWLTGREALELAGRLHDVGTRTLSREIEQTSHRLGFAAELDEPIGRYVPAQRERLALAAALLHDPEVLLLDEPLRSVDPRQRKELLTEVGQRRTVLLRSRYPAREREICDRVAFLRDGRIAVDAPIADLTARGVTLSLSGLEAFAAPGGGAERPGRPGGSGPDNGQRGGAPSGGAGRGTEGTAASRAAATTSTGVAGDGAPGGRRETETPEVSAGSSTASRS